MYVRTFMSFYQELRRTRQLMGNYDRKQLAKQMYAAQFAPGLRSTVLEHL